MGEKWTQWQTLFSWAPKSLRTETEVMKLKDACSWEENYTKSRQCIKKQRRHFADKGPYTQSYGFSSGHEWMSELDHKEGWALKNWCFWTVVLEKTHESPLDTKEIKPVHPKGNGLWIFIGRTDIEAEAPIFGAPNVKSQLIGKDLVGMLGKIEGRRRRGRQRMKWLDENIQPSLSQWTWVWANSGR